MKEYEKKSLQTKLKRNQKQLTFLMYLLDERPISKIAHKSGYSPLTIRGFLHKWKLKSLNVERDEKEKKRIVKEIEKRIKFHTEKIHRLQNVLGLKNQNE